LIEVTLNVTDDTGADVGAAMGAPAEPAPAVVAVEEVSEPTTGAGADPGLRALNGSRLPMLTAAGTTGFVDGAAAEGLVTVGARRNWESSTAAFCPSMK
jgi:hypothetical protein